MQVTLCYYANVHRAEVVLTRIVGALLILLGLVLFGSPRITYTTSQKIAHTRYSIKREKTIIVPRAVSILIMGAGTVILIFTSRTPDE